MATIKSYTDIEQSKKLAEILPLESADMWWLYITAQGKYIAMMHEEPDSHYLTRMESYGIKDAAIRCWSLAALIQVLPITIVDSWTDYCLMLDIKAKMPRYVKYGDIYHPEFPWDFKKQSLLDSIVESIFWLHKNNYLNGSNR